MKNLDLCILDLADKLSKAKYSDDQRNLTVAIDRLKEMQAIENAHEQEMERIRATLPPPETMASVMSRLLDWLIYGRYEPSQ